MQEEPVTNAASGEYSVEDSPFGRVVVANGAPRGFALFYTTIDFPGATSTGVGAINSARQIVGTYSNASSQLHGFLATPESLDPAPTASTSRWPWMVRGGRRLR